MLKTRHSDTSKNTTRSLHIAEQNHQPFAQCLPPGLGDRAFDLPHACTSESASRPAHGDRPLAALRAPTGRRLPPPRPSGPRRDNSPAACLRRRSAGSPSPATRRRIDRAFSLTRTSVPPLLLIP